MSVQTARLAAVHSVVYHDWDSKPDYDAIPQSVIDNGMQVADMINVPANRGFLNGNTLPSNPQNMYAAHANMLAASSYPHFVGATDKEFIEEYGPDFIHVPAHLINSLQPLLIDGHLQPIGVDLPTNPAARVSIVQAQQRDPGVAGAPLKGPFAPQTVPQAGSNAAQVDNPDKTADAGYSWAVLGGIAVVLYAFYYSSLRAQ